ncbi:macrophage-expressed gene 1 protein-like [Ruditapes philippinarum]|uniref:macrophage-expressed gene 1 protein-like n=1 Tax=Ruditapes philippinarum TaxID=129788 RepID=UPI00295A5AF6|nr:macrophage-expressed gene 1 protein-like [Ruditapes philippinarum]
MAKLPFLLILVFTVSSAFNESDSIPKQKYTLPEGHPERCFIMLAEHKDLRRLEALPGGGWDNLRNKDMGAVVQHTYHKCMTTEDGRFLIPDSITTLPIKTSGVSTVSEFFDHWDSYTSVSSSSINLEVEVLGIPIGGKFSTEYGNIKTKQISEKSSTTRMQLRYRRYNVILENGYTLHPSFKSRVQKIAADLMLNRSRLASYESQLLVRDYGTHVINNVELGATLVKTDQITISQDGSSESDSRQRTISAAAAAFFEEVGIHFGVSYSTSSSNEAVNNYKNSRLSSEIITLGGDIYKPSQYSAENWSSSIENNLVPLDRSGDPLYLFVNENNLPGIPEYIIEKVHSSVKKAVYRYYIQNVHKGCTVRNAPNFSFQANVNDSTCDPPKTSFTFGGVYQTCSNTGYVNLCDGMSVKNPLTGDFSCPNNYEAIRINSGKKTQQRNRAVIVKCGWFFHLGKCAKNVIDIASADYEAFWCAKINASSPGGYMFGGLYTQHIDNVVTQTKVCPAYFIPLTILEDLTICVSDDYEQGSQFNLPFAGLFSCAAGNPMALDSIKGTNRSYPNSCPEGYSQHLADVDDGCEINYCIQSGAITMEQLPKIKLPPYMSRPLDIPQKETEDDSSMTIFSSDGTSWSSLEDEVVKAASSNNTLIFLIHSNALDATDKNYEQVSAVTVAVISVTGTLLFVLIVKGIAWAIRRRRGATLTYQRFDDLTYM